MDKLSDLLPSDSHKGQLNSFEDDLIFMGIGKPSFRAIFIRESMILEADTGVHVFSRLNDNRIVAVEQGNL